MKGENTIHDKFVRIEALIRLEHLIEKQKTSNKFPLPPLSLSKRFFSPFIHHIQNRK
jgi:hypothetical protein